MFTKYTKKKFSNNFIAVELNYGKRLHINNSNPLPTRSVGEVIQESYVRNTKHSPIKNTGAKLLMSNARPLNFAVRNMRVQYS